MRGGTFGEEYKQIDTTLLKRLVQFLRPYKAKVASAVFLTLLVSAMGPLRPYLTKVAIDDYIMSADQTGLLNIIIAIFALLIVHGALRFALTYLMQIVGQHILYDIRTALFEKIHKMTMSYYDKTPVGRLVTRVTNDVEVLNQLFSSGLIMIIADVLLIFWLIGFMFYTSWQLALITLIVLPMLLVVTYVFKNKVRVIFRDIRLEVSKMNSFLNELFAGISTVKLFTQEKRRARMFDDINDKTRELNIQTVYWYSLFYPVVEIIGAIGLVLILWYAAGNILSGYMTIGIAVAFIQYAEMFFRPVRDISEKYTTLQNAMASSERIFSLLDDDNIIRDIENSIELQKLEDKIEFKNVSFTYDDQKWVLKDASFTVKKGETVAIVGATGSGKSTIINLICKFYDNQKGSITIDGIDIKNIQSQSWRQKIALVMQDVFLFSRSIADNITLGNENLTEKDILEAADALGSRDFIERQVNKFDTKLIERGQTLSVGQRQLISFCRAYAAKPELLILDEATSNIDSETESIIEKSLTKLLEGRTSIVIAHRLSTIKRADKIIVLHKGEIKETGTHEELLNHKGLYSKLYQLQYQDDIAVAK